MLTREENELVTRVGPGTPLGEVMRRYWVPVALSSELAEPDGAPLRVRLLGENLVAFRDSSGRLGLVDEYCAHRRASLFLGRNEEEGLRCVYHGWKYDVAGRCVDMPTEPPESSFKDRIRLKAYRTLELGEVIWAYLGPRDRTPPPPNLEWTQVAASHRTVSRTWQDCNWLQALEGGIDSIHTGFLHRVLDPSTPRAGTRGNITRWAGLREEVFPTEYGLYYGSIRPMDDGGQYVRVYHFVMPFHTYFPNQLVPGGPFPQVMGHMFVPIDDENTMVFNLVYRFEDPPISEEERARNEVNRGRGPGEISADQRKRRNQDNNWMLDRQVQRSETFSGIEGINTQDHAVQESMGRIVDRTQEHLGASDKAVIGARRALLQAIGAVQAGGEPPGTDGGGYRFRAIERMLGPNERWTEAIHADIFPPAMVTA
jgi:phenylpropionate dioxygenase-like ring-hydroxylating dioxygenase large terminal subunit